MSRLVNYSSSSASSGTEEGGEEKEEENNSQDVTSKKRRLEDLIQGSDKERPLLVNEMPPLPTAFHDLYASSVRQSVVDDPGLHQGRKRQVLHTVGQWPSHVYIEWNSTVNEQSTLRVLLKTIKRCVDDQVELHSLLSSDLGAALPLHISLSRPLSLPTADKGKYLDAIQESLSRSGVRAFTVQPVSLAWFQSPDSDRSFLVLRVAEHNTGLCPNPKLLELLQRSNKVAKTFEQPPLYAKDMQGAAEYAFHISIGWSLGMPPRDTEGEVIKMIHTQDFSEILQWKIEVGSIKVKIGNVVDSVSLDSTFTSSTGSNLFED